MTIRLQGAAASTRRRILDASLELFSERGFHGVTIHDIAVRVGVTDGALYRHFASKRELLKALFVEHGLDRAFAELTGIPEEVPLERALVSMSLASLAFVQRNRELFKLIVLEGLVGDEAAREQYSELREGWTARVQQLIERRAESERLTPGSAPLLAAQIVAYLWGVIIASFAGRCAAPLAAPDGVVEMGTAGPVRDVVLRLLRGSRAPAVC